MGGVFFEEVTLVPDTAAACPYAGISSAALVGGAFCENDA
jgi:hypothetical protein